MTTYGNPVGTIPAHLPKRLTISFPIWGLEDTAPDGMYHDLDKMVAEHVERGFNCIRLESGAGLTHDLEGNRLPPTQILAPFGKYDDNRQLFCIGGEGKCDFLTRLIDLCKACQKYDVYLILSSWYYLHTYWYMDEDTNARLFAIPVGDRFMAFAKFLHYILCELEALGLDDRIATAEIFNEMGDLPYLWSLAGENRAEIDATFRQKHEEALAFLLEKHPQIVFSCDDSIGANRIGVYPRNMQVYNGHNYFLWSIYSGMLEGANPDRKYYRGEVTHDDVANAYTHANYSPDWIDRTRNCHDVNPVMVSEMEWDLEKKLLERWDDYMTALDRSVEGYRQIMASFPGIPVMCGEGVSYCSSKIVLWEEKSPLFWKMVETAMRKYKEAGLWGTVVKTCCGPEDPCWHLCKDKLKEMNEMFLRDE